ncbi:hypothetical protein SLA2020_448220 [Shorea laevis]
MSLTLQNLFTNSSSRFTLYFPPKTPTRSCHLTTPLHYQNSTTNPNAFTLSLPPIPTTELASELTNPTLTYTETTSSGEVSISIRFFRSPNCSVSFRRR